MLPHTPLVANAATCVSVHLPALQQFKPLPFSTDEKRYGQLRVVSGIGKRSIVARYSPTKA